MSLVSPGVQVTIIDQSQYIPAATNSVPYVLLVTAENKISGAGVGVAAGTLKVNANKTYLITSQRDLSATFGVPFFYNTAAGTPINGYELNEYGLLAAYSSLGVSNRCYVQRADIDLAQLTATLVRPTGSPPDGTYWLDTANSVWGIFEWNQTTAAFTNKIPSVITDINLLESGYTVPLQSYGSIGDYAVVSVHSATLHNPVYYKRGGPTSSQTTVTALSELYNTWVLVGSDDWKTSWPTVAAYYTSTSPTGGDQITINGTTVTVPSSPNNTATGVAEAINTAFVGNPVVMAAVINGRLNLYATYEATDSGNNYGTGVINIQNVGSGTALAALGITSGRYYAPEYQGSYSYDAPRWRTTDTQPEPTGSVWQKINNVNLGTNLVIKKYNATLGTFVLQGCGIYTNVNEAIYALDPSGGGTNIPAGTLIGNWNPDKTTPPDAGIEILERYATGPMIVTGTTVPGPTAFTNGSQFTISFTVPGSSAYVNPVTATLTGTSPADFLNAFSAAVGQTGYSYVSASINSSGNIVLTHSTGGNIRLNNVTHDALSVAGFTLDTPFVYTGPAGAGYLLSYFVTAPIFTYTSSASAPDQDPANGRYWYYSTAEEVDIMIQNNGEWMGYQNVSNDVRGYNLTMTNATGPIFSTTAPKVQSDGTSPLQPGDLWIDTSDLENYPIISRWQTVSGTGEWVLLDNTDQTTENGILFADARWSPTGTANPVSDPIPTITSLLTSNYLDLDAPDPALYPQGTLLWNTRRSGFNVKTFQANYFNSTTFGVNEWNMATYYYVGNYVLYNGEIYVATAEGADHTPTNTAYWSLINTNTWLTDKPTKADGSPYMGRQSQRIQIVTALKAGIDSSVTAREEQINFNLLSCPQYPELTFNLAALNNERNDTAFVVADTPLRMTPDNAIVDFATNDSGLGLTTGDGLNVGGPYIGTFYPSCQTTDLSGNLVVQPPSHMMLRTIIRSDEVSYPWLAPAGTRRGVIDNATQIGYINSQTGEFVSLGVNQGIRDVLYTNRINPITFIPGVGITNFGNKTVTSVDSALNRINVARLVAFIRGRLTEIAKQYLFEPNDQITRNEITNAITSLMLDLVAKRGIYDYLVVCDLTNNTPATIDANELHVDIAIEPVKAVEFIYIPVRIAATGAIAAQAIA